MVVTHSVLVVPHPLVSYHDNQCDSGESLSVEVLGQRHSSSVHGNRECEICVKKEG